VARLQLFVLHDVSGQTVLTAYMKMMQKNMDKKTAVEHSHAPRQDCGTLLEDLSDLSQLLTHVLS
jgi:hypothetical protein